MSYTDIMQQELQKAQTIVLQVTRIGRDEYSELMFHHGTMFAERFASKYLNKDDVYTALTQQPEYGFWNWWKMKWQMDDAAIMKHDVLNRECFAEDGNAYTMVKATMIGDPLFEDELYHDIKHLL